MNDRLIAVEALALAGAASLAERDVTTLSGGELARVQFARVLAQLRPQDVDSGAQPTPPLDVYLYWHENAELDPANRWLRGVLGELFPEQEQLGSAAAQ